MLDKEKNKDKTESLHCDTGYESKILECETLVKCYSSQHSTILEKNIFMTKIPIVLSELEVEITLDREIELIDNATYVNIESKHTVITECNVIPYTNNLFIEGYVQKYIEFYEKDNTIDSSVNGLLKHITVNLPFKVATEVPFQVKPKYGNTVRKPLEILKKSGLKKESTEYSWFYYNKPQDPIYCELQWVKILETNTLSNLYKKNESNYEKHKDLEKLLIKMALHIGLKVLQNQSVYLEQLHEGVARMQQESSKNTDQEECTDGD